MASKTIWSGPVTRTERFVIGGNYTPEERAEILRKTKPAFDAMLREVFERMEQ
ncbi:hypothetical protein HY492_02065 [Candidatus Woesearchaeota archaeon]|nr:hypothetical protein [Candidatus Woesearchaeota archaeon]